jgi:hypothetical protein
MTFFKGPKPMFKHTILAAIGLTAALGATAHADTIITYGPGAGIISGLSPYNSPSFGRLVEMCETVGIDCSAPGADIFAYSPEAQADADKRIALYEQEWEEFVEDYDHVELLPAPVLPRPFGFYGYPAPRPLPLPPAQLFGFGDRFDVLPYPRVPHRILPYGSFPRGPVIPWPSL